MGAIESKGGWDDSIDESGRAEVVVFFNLLEERGRGYVLFRGWYVIVHSDKHFIDIFSNKKRVPQLYKRVPCTNTLVFSRVGIFSFRASFPTDSPGKLVVYPLIILFFWRTPVEAPRSKASRIITKQRHQHGGGQGGYGGPQQGGGGF